MLDFTTVKGVERAHVIGTSRGGIIAMVMGLIRPALLASVTLNDIGPVIERDGLMRIVGYVGRVPLPPDWKDAQKLVRDINKAQFPMVTDEEWMEVARAWFNDESGLPTQGYDPKLANAISMTNFDEGIPTMWPQFEVPGKVPLARHSWRELGYPQCRRRTPRWPGSTPAWKASWCPSRVTRRS